MYIVKNLTDGTESQCDAIETIRWTGGRYVPAEQSNADGFRAMTIVDVDKHTQRYDVTDYAFPNHILSGTEPTGTFEAVEPPEPEQPEPEPQYTEIQLLGQQNTDLELRIMALEDKLYG